MAFVNVLDYEKQYDVGEMRNIRHGIFVEIDSMIMDVVDSILPVAKGILVLFNGFVEDDDNDHFIESMEYIDEALSFFTEAFPEYYGHPDDKQAQMIIGVRNDLRNSNGGDIA